MWHRPPCAYSPKPPPMPSSSRIPGGWNRGICYVSCLAASIRSPRGLIRHQRARRCSVQHAERRQDAGVQESRTQGTKMWCRMAVISYKFVWRSMDHRWKGVKNESVDSLIPQAIRDFVLPAGFAAMELVLALEEPVNEKLHNLHAVATKCNDPQLPDFIKSEFLADQNSIRILLESAIRNNEEFQVTGKDVKNILDLENNAPKAS